MREDLLKLAAKVLRVEGEGILGLIPRLDTRFLRALELLQACRGRVVVMGIGKSGIIGRKVAATLASVGTPRSSSTPPRVFTATSGWSRGMTWP